MKRSTPASKVNKAKAVAFSLAFLIINNFFPDHFLRAQQIPLLNGTLITQAYIDEIEANLTDERLMPFDPENPDLNDVFTIEVFVVRDDLGNLNFEVADLNTAIANLNSQFEPMGISFNTGSIKDVPEYEYSFITNQDSTKELEVKYAHQDKINLFLVDSILLNGFDYYGYTFYPTESNRNFIFLRKDYILQNYLTTLMGCFFGLLFTHEKMGGTEYVSGSNCESAGDYICDTYADPGLFEMVDESCHYVGNARDPEGEFYIPSVANIMSESPDTCKCNFTNEQYRRMKYYLFNLRDYLR